MVNFGMPFVGSTFSRVTGSLTRSVILSNMSRNQEEMLLTQEQLSTGLRLVHPSVDPLGTRYALDFQLHIEQNVEFDRTLGSTLGQIRTADQALGQMKELVDRAYTLGLAQGTDSATPETRRAAATEIDGLLREAVNLANTRIAGRYLFGGSVTTGAPFSFVGDAVAYGGNEDVLTLRIADGLTIPANVLGSQAFGAISEELRAEQDLNPVIVSGTKLSSLNRGQGVRLGSLFFDDGTTSATVDLAGAETVGDVILRVNSQLALAGVTLTIDFNPTADGFQITNGSGPNVIVQEVLNGKTAADLGILTPAAGSASPLIGTDLDPVIVPQTALADLVSGTGLDLSGIVITNQTQGQTFTANLSFAGLTTVEEVLNVINNSGTFVRATINEAGTGIDVRSVLSGSRMTIEENGGTTAAQMGIEYTMDRTKLRDLNGGLGVDLVEGDDLRITLTSGTSFTVDLSAADDLGDAVAAIQNAALAAGIPAGIFSISINDPNGHLVLTDNSVGAGTLTVENLNGSFTASNLGIERAATAPPAAVVSGSSLNAVGLQAEGIFTAMLRLRQAMEGNDVPGIRRAQEMLQKSLEPLLTARGETGSRMARMELTRNRLADDGDQLKKMLADVRDVDVAEAATRFQLQSSILQAALSTAARILDTTLFNFI